MNKLEARRNRGATFALAAAFVIVGGGAAVAYWTSTGSGSGTATTGTSSAFTVETHESSGGPMEPGGEGTTVPFSVSHLGESSQSLTTLTAVIANADGSDWTAEPGCSAADYAVGVPTITFGRIDAGSDIDGSVVVSMIETDENQDACQDVAVPLYFTAG